MCQHLQFANGIASHDTFGRVFSLLDAKQFEACFVRWVGALCPSLEGQHIAIDGKCVRGSPDGKQSAIHLVSAWNSASGVTLGQVRSADKIYVFAMLRGEKVAHPADDVGVASIAIAIGGLCHRAVAGDLEQPAGKYRSGTPLLLRPVGMDRGFLGRSRASSGERVGRNTNR